MKTVIHDDFIRFARASRAEALEDLVAIDYKEGYIQQVVILAGLAPASKAVAFIAVPGKPPKVPLVVDKVEST